MNTQKNTATSGETLATATSQSPTKASRLYLYNNIPKEMKEYPNWLVRKGKIPYSPVTGINGNRVEHCGTYEQAIKVLECGQYDGIGFQFSGSPFTGIDLDHCVKDVNTGEINEFATDIIIMCQSYWEYSPSRTGIHIIVYGEIPEALKRKEIEMYSEGRYFTVTGDVFAYSDIVNGQEAIDNIYKQFGITASSIKAIAWGDYKELNEVEIMQLVTKIKKYDNTGKFTMLYNTGDISAYKSGSEADSALLTILAYWTKGDPVQMEQIFSNSPLSKRLSSDGKNHWARLDYRKRTIERAIAFYGKAQAERVQKMQTNVIGEIFGGNE